MPMMTAEQAAERGKSLTFEKVWAMFEETDKKFAETDKKFAETDKQIQETGKNLMRLEQHIDRVTENIEAMGRRIDRVTENIEAMGRRGDRVTENIEAMGKRIDRVTENIEAMGRRVDRVTENIDTMGKKVDRVSENLGGLNRSMGELVETLIAARLWEKFPRYDLKRAYRRVPLYDEKNQIKTDIDILLVNTVMYMAVEVKHELNRKDEVDEHLKRMKLIRQYPPPLITADNQLVGAMAGGNVNPDVRDYAYKSGFYVLEMTGESVQLVTPPEGFEPQKW